MKIDATSIDMIMLCRDHHLCSRIKRAIDKNIPVLLKEISNSEN